MYEINCRVEWGYWHGYFGDKYCVKMDFSGSIEIGNGNLKSLEKAEIPYEMWGPYVYSKKFIKLNGNSWNSVILKWLEGIRFKADVEDDSVICLNIGSETYKFTPERLKKEKHIVFPVGEKYSMAFIHVEFNDSEWYLPDLREGQYLVDAKDFDSPQKCVEFFTVKGRMIEPHSSAKASVNINLTDCCDSFCESACKIRIRYVLSDDSKREVNARGVAKFVIRINNKDAYRNVKFDTWHDTASQFFSEVWADVDFGLLCRGENKIEILNMDDEFSIILQSVLIEPYEKKHMSLVWCPKWALKGRIFSVTVNFNTASCLEINYDKNEFKQTIIGTDKKELHQEISVAGLCPVNMVNVEILALEKGEHEFFFEPLKGNIGGKIEFIDKWSGRRCCAVVDAVWDVIQEQVPVKTGFEVRTGSPFEYMDLLKKSYNSQLGNLAVFRDYHNNAYHPSVLWDCGEYCRKHGIYTDAIWMNSQAVIAYSSDKLCMCVGGHEHTGIFYGRDETDDSCKNMKESMEASTEKLRAVRDMYEVASFPVGMGDASGGTRCAYLAGFDVIRHETFVCHHALILSNARGNARAFGKNNWGVHIASQHAHQPEFEPGIRRYFLGMYLPWVYGSTFAFEEDSLFAHYKCTRMAGDDYHTRMKQEITRGFYKYSSTHPREGENAVDIAILQGRYAPPFNGISSANNNGDNTFSDDDFPVWGHKGRKEKNWGFRQPEKGFHLLDVLTPGIYVTPLKQNNKKVRKFFGGNPYGEYDQLPVEAPQNIFDKYKLVAVLNWHTMEMRVNGEVNDYDKLIGYVKSGGTLFVSVPHFTTRSDRDFLTDMNDLKLYNNGDISELCGVKVIGKSEAEYSSAVINDCASDFFNISGFKEKLIRKPNKDENEDGECKVADIVMCGSEAIITDKNSGKPLVTRYKLGNGTVYLLNTFAFPGHEKLKYFMHGFFKTLCKNIHNKADVVVCDQSSEVYSSVWKSGEKSGKIYLLNTDWLTAGNTIDAYIRIDGFSACVGVTEGYIKEVIYFDGGIAYADKEDVYICNTEKDRFSVYSDKPANITVSAKNDFRVMSDDGTLISKSVGCCSRFKILPEKTTYCGTYIINMK